MLDIFWIRIHHDSAVRSLDHRKITANDSHKARSYNIFVSSVACKEGCKPIAIRGMMFQIL